MTKRNIRLMWIERSLLVSGVILLAVYASAHVDMWIASSAALRQFDRVHAQDGHGNKADADTVPNGDNIDFSLWSEKRIAAFRESLLLKQDLAVAVLELNRLGIRVPVFEGTDDLTLNRGAGWIGGTAKPGDAGNTGIAAHRDGFFRGLKDVEAGDLIDLRTPEKTMVYRVVQTRIVNPEDVHVLRPRGVPSLTLVTCYPFYHIGSAPQRFIVHADLQRDSETSRSERSVH